MVSIPGSSVDLSKVDAYEADLDRLKKIVTDPWEFLSTCVYTQDQSDKQNPVKKFPSQYKYLKLYTRIWEVEPLIIVPKSRRMFMSWINIALYTWATIFWTDRLNIFQSKKEDGSEDLVKRALFILEHIPPEVLPRELIPSWRKTYCRLEFEEIDSKIWGVPQGEDQLRQYTASGLLFDEFAFWDKAEESYSAAIPTIEGGGRCTIISSAAPSYMKRIVYDQLDEIQVGEAP